MPWAIKKILEYIKGDINSIAITIEDFNTPLTTMNGLSRQKSSREIVALGDILFQMNLIYRRKFNFQKGKPQDIQSHINGRFNPKTEYMFISSTHGTFSRID